MRVSIGYLEPLVAYSETLYDSDQPGKASKKSYVKCYFKEITFSY